MTKYNLHQSKLDVVNKTRSNIFDWRGQFTPELIEYLLSVFTKPGEVVADPFSGSGTVLYEALKAGCSTYGFEINPSAFYMSKFYEYCKLSIDQRYELIEDIRKILGAVVRDMNPNIMVYENSTDYRTAYSSLLEFARHCNKIISAFLMPFVMNVLFMCEKDKKMTLRESLIKNINILKKLLLCLPVTHCDIQANWADARSISNKYPKSIDLIITSPPYINVFNYHQNYRGIIECFNYNLLNVANSEIGSNRKNRQNRFKTVVQYSIDMGHTLQSCTSSLKANGIMIWIVGRCSSVRKVSFSNSSIISELVDAIPGIIIDARYQREFGNRYGEKIIEDILIIKKTSDREYASLKNSFEAIGLKHLEKALPYVADIDKPDIEVLLHSGHLIQESPILQQI